MVSVECAEKEMRLGDGGVSVSREEAVCGLLVQRRKEVAVCVCDMKCELE